MKTSILCIRGCVLSTLKKTGRKILRILTNKFSKIHYIISQKNQMRYLLGSKSHWIVGQKSRKFALYYRHVLSKKATLSNVTPFGIKITLAFWSTKSKHCSILQARVKQKSDFQWEHLWHWHLLALKSQLIITQKIRKNAQYYRQVLRKWSISQKIRKNVNIIGAY